MLNENYYMSVMLEGVEEGICKGIYKFEIIEGSKGKVQLFGFGFILCYVCEVVEILVKDYGVGFDVYSVIFFIELVCDGQDCECWNMLYLLEILCVLYIVQVMNDVLVVVFIDYMKLFVEQVCIYVLVDDYCVLGIDGFGCFDSCENLCYYFEVDVFYVVVVVLGELVKCGEIDKKVVVDVIVKFNIDVDKVNLCLV